MLHLSPHSHIFLPNSLWPDSPTHINGVAYSIVCPWIEFVIPAGVCQPLKGGGGIGCPSLFPNGGGVSP
jgi:hypothetical protein